MFSWSDTSLTSVLGGLKSAASSAHGSNGSPRAMYNSSPSHHMRSGHRAPPAPLSWASSPATSPRKPLTNPAAHTMPTLSPPTASFLRPGPIVEGRVTSTHAPATRRWIPTCLGAGARGPMPHIMAAQPCLRAAAHAELVCTCSHVSPGPVAEGWSAPSSPITPRGAVRPPPCRVSPSTPEGPWATSRLTPHRLPPACRIAGPVAASDALHTDAITPSRGGSSPLEVTLHDLLGRQGSAPTPAGGADAPADGVSFCRSVAGQV